MRFLIVFLATILAAYSLSEKEEWVYFKEKHGRTYHTISEENYRFKVFKDNLHIIREHNARYENGEETFYMGVNKFTDQTPVEYRDMINRQKPLLKKIQKNNNMVQSNELTPEYDDFDWRQWGAVLDVRDQGDCGSSWVFAVIGALEGQNTLVNHNDTLLSTQQIMDCSVPFGAECQIGGNFADGFLYVMDNGIEAEAGYPYTGDQHTCRDDLSKSFMNIYGYIESDLEIDLDFYMVNIGPIATMINADCMQHYEGGVFSNSSCPTGLYDLNFGVLAVGYNTTTEDGIDFWILKNSFGTDWGEQGYFRLEKGVNELGIGQYNAHPIAKFTPKL